MASVAAAFLFAVTPIMSVVPDSVDRSTAEAVLVTLMQADLFEKISS